MKPVRRLVTAAAVAVLALALVAGPAVAKKGPKGQFTYYATIDCGSGPIEVGSTDDLWAPLVDVQSGKKYTPVAWHVAFDGGSLDENKKGEPKKHAVDCSYDDGVATGTVVVKKA